MIWLTSGSENEPLSSSFQIDSPLLSLHHRPRPLGGAGGFWGIFPNGMELIQMTSIVVHTFPATS